MNESKEKGKKEDSFRKAGSSVVIQKARGSLGVESVLSMCMALRWCPSAMKMKMMITRETINSLLGVGGCKPGVPTS